MGTGSSVTEPRRESVRFGTLVLAGARLITRLAGFLATFLIARSFGAAPATDAFFVAQVLPFIFLDWAANILRVGFIPPHARLRVERGDDEARAVAMQFATHGLIIFAAIAAACWLLAPLIIRLLATGFDPETHLLGAGMLRMLAPSILASGLFVITETVLNAGQHFSSPARGRLWGRVAVVVALLVLARPLGVNAMPVSFLVGVGVQLVGLGPDGLRLWRSFRPIVRPWLPGSRQIAALLGPAIVWMMIDQLKFLVDQNFASRLDSGQLAALNYAFRIVQVVIGVTAGAYVTALFPRLAEMVAEGGPTAATATTAGRRLVAFAAFAAAYVAVGATPIVRVLLEHGVFTSEATAATSGALRFYAPSIVFISINMLLKSLLFLNRRVGLILLVGVGELVLNVVLDALLIGPLGIRGLALASTITTLAVTLILPVTLSRQGLITVGPLIDILLRLLPGIVVTVIVTGVAVRMMPAHGWLGAAVALAMAAVVAGGLYAALARVLGLRDLRLRGGLR